MGTRSLTLVRVDGQTLVTIYRQFDGYLSGHGANLASFLRGRIVGNGIGLQTDSVPFSNGMGDLAAQLLAHLKKDHAVGGIYVHLPDTNGDEDYSYVIEGVFGACVPTVTVHSGAPDGPVLLGPEPLPDFVARFFNAKGTQRKKPKLPVEV